MPQIPDSFQVGIVGMPQDPQFPELCQGLLNSLRCDRSLRGLPPEGAHYLDIKKMRSMQYSFAAQPGKNSSSSGCVAQ